MSKALTTRELYREQEFAFIDETSEWIARDYYGNDLEGLISVFEGLKECVDEWLERYKDNA